ncbi:MAG: PQQ-dependent sugar dehydrogenase [Planctomycetes bacterium]|nr:PQQ-dependent sugar dehydrogenase [Planctomycetota bacterium]
MTQPSPRSRVLPFAVVHGATALALALVVGCGGGGGGGGGGSGGDSGLDARPPAPSLAFPLTAPTTGSVEAYDGFPNLRFSSPVFVTAAPGDATRLFVVEQGGRIRVFPASASTTSGQVRTFLDLTSRVTSGGELGLLGLAFDPGYATNRRFYVNYTTGSGGSLRSVVARYQRSAADPDAADPTETPLFEVAQPYSNHNGGMLAFGPDGFLYGSFGDGGDAGDPQGNGQRLSTLLGKIFRVDPSVTVGATPYGIPSDNPFAASTGTERKEIYAWGLRNPWRFSFDRGTGRLFAGDVGQGSREEIDVVVRGGNYGWRGMEGTQVYDGGSLGSGPFTAPVHEYGRSTGSCVIGGYVYRGTAIPFLVGHYVFADYGSGRVWSFSYDGTSAGARVELAGVSGLSSFGEDAAGELLACEHGGGRILRFRPTVPGTTPFPQTLSATGIYADLATLTPAAGVLPYDVNAPLWSDGALKDRFVTLPGTSRIGFSQDGAWSFPTQTVLVKTFRLPLVVGDPSSAVPVETRVLVLSASGWEGYSYRWRADGTDADLLAGADTRSFDVADASAPGGQRVQTWAFPSRTDCLRCHTAAAGRVLGLTTRQLNRTFDFGPLGGRVGNQLDTWSDVGLFDVALPASAALPAHPRPDDLGAPVAARARAWLDANCAGCHRPGGGTPSTMDLRSTVSVASMGVVGVAPQQGGLGLPDPRIVTSGARAASVLWLRVGALDGNRMPPLGSSVVDADGQDLVGDWIDGGP